MALIKCPECGQEVPDDAKMCPNCVYPIFQEINEPSYAPPQDVYPQAPASRSIYVPKCPICGSTNLSKISRMGKILKVSFLGLLGADDIGKTWKCNNCDSKW